MLKVRFADSDCTLSFDRYRQNGRIAMRLKDETGMPLAAVTVNLPELDLAADEVVIKSDRENTGMLEALLDAGIVEPPHATAHGDFVSFPVCRLSDAAAEEARYVPDLANA